MQRGAGASHSFAVCLPAPAPADTDVTYTVKPLWDSYLEFIDRAGGDGAWQFESPRKQ